MFVGTSWAAVDTRAATARNALQFEWEVSRTGGAAASLITTALDQAAARARGEGGRPYPGTAFRRVRGRTYLAAAATSSWHGPVKSGRSLELAQRGADLGPRLLPGRFVQADEHLLQCAERVLFEAQALVGRRHPQRRVDRLDPHVAEARGVQGGFQYARRAEAERPGL